MQQYCQRARTFKSKWCLNDEEDIKHWNQMQWTTATNCAIRHTMTNSSGKQQHRSCSNSSIATQTSSRNTWQVYSNTYGYTRTSYSSVQCNYYLSGPVILCCETTHTTMPIKKRWEKSGTPVQKKESIPGVEPSTSCSQAVQATF